VLPALTFGLFLSRAAPASAVEVVRVGDTRLVIGGEVVATFAHRDRGYFNNADYDGSYSQSALRLFNLAVSAELASGEHLSLLTEARSNDLDPPWVQALYLRARPFIERSLDFQVGKIPPVFGAFGRRRYGADNPLIGSPLGYQYLTSLRSDAVPRNVDELLRWRGRGYYPYYTVGSDAAGPGLPLLNPYRWDTGVEARMGSRSVELAVAVTQGTLASGRFRDDNDGKQLAGRLAVRPLFGLVVGLSAARGEYLAESVTRRLPDPGAGPFRQRALGLDLEYARGYWLLRGEAIFSEWDSPASGPPPVEGPLRALAVTAESRYRILPGLHAALRFDHLGFSRVEGSEGSLSWDAPVTRLEAGVSYSLSRRLLLKAAYQQNWRDGGTRRREGFLAGQVLLWF